MGQYLTRPQTGPYFLGSSFTLNYNSHFKKTHELTTVDVLNTVQDAARYHSLMKNLENYSDQLPEGVLELLWTHQQRAGPDLKSDKERITSLLQTVAQLREDQMIAKILHRQKEELRAHLCATENTIRLLQRDNEGLTTKIYESTSNLRGLQESLNGREMEIRLLERAHQQELRKYQQALAESETEVAEISQLVRSLDNGLSTVGSDVLARTSDLEEALTLIETLEPQLASAADAFDNLLLRLQILEKENELLKNR